MIREVISTLKQQFFDCWWVYFFALLCFICYEQGSKVRNTHYQMLSKQLQKLQDEKMDAQALHGELMAQIQSQSDDEWIELLLMRELGVVPEGQKKVYFTK